MKNAQKTVSIICPVRNEEVHIGKCLESLVNQTFDREKTEILVVDGMSDDNTRDIVLTLQKKHENIRLLDNPAKIVPVALNIGIRASSGDYILRMDGHAMADSRYVEKCIDALEKTDVAGVGGPIISINRNSTGKAIALAMSSRFGVGNSRFRTSGERCFVDTVAFAAYRRDIFEKYGLFDEEMVRCQDDEYNFRLRKFGEKILLTPEIKSRYYPRSDFSGLWKQYFGYGCWKVRILQKHFWKMQIRHFIPAMFVSVLLLTLLSVIFFPESVRIFTGIAGLYLICAITAAFFIRHQKKVVSIYKIILSYFILHFSYGTGFLWGLIKFSPHWIKIIYPFTFSYRFAGRIQKTGPGA